ncbi:MAG: nucleotidyl transferase AbiEii/AbiGii toxin family protein [Spirochaetaceae bacterium]
MNVFDEFFDIVRALESEDIKYALVGGVAMAFYTEPRFTRDIDILTVADQFIKIEKVLRRFGYFESITPWEFKNIHVTLHRFFKSVEKEEMLIDILEGDSNEVKGILKRAVVAESNEGRVHLVKKDDLIGLKRLRNSTQDRADIERLESEED